MSLTETVRRYILETLHADLCGFAPASALEEEPEGYRPTDIMPGAKSIIVFGKRIPDGAVQAAMRRLEDGNLRAESLYSTFGAEVFPGMALFFDTFNLAEYLERSFPASAVPLPCGPMQCGLPVNTDLPLFSGPWKAGIPMNIDRAALAAGLGEFGWSNRFLTPEFGPRVQFGAVLTNLELEPDGPYTGPRLCDPAACGVCARVCPTCAIAPVSPDNALEVGAGEKRCTVSRFVPNRCSVAAMALRKKYAGASPVEDAVDTEDPTDQELIAGLKKRPIDDYTLDHYPKFHCDRCLLYCPAGDWKRRFADRGLSRFTGGDGK